MIQRPNHGDSAPGWLTSKRIWRYDERSVRSVRCKETLDRLVLRRCDACARSVVVEAAGWCPCGEPV